MLIDFPEKDLPLRDDIRELGATLGHVLTEQGGPALLERVEEARLAAGTALEVVQAFSTYFGLVNMAERVHRIRRARSYTPNDKRSGGASDDAGQPG